MSEAATFAAYMLHIAGGLIGLVSGTIAILARKGGRLHRRAGNIFFASMLVMAGFAIYLAIVIPDQLVNVFIGIFALYLITTAWLIVRRPAGTAGLAEKLALGVGIAISAPFGILAFDLATGLAPPFHSAIAFEGPVLIALYAFTAVLALIVLGDIRLVLAGGITGIPRISRHLWRMCFGLTLAAGSAFTNGFARLLPGPYHVPPAFFLPQFLPLILLIFWMIRVRLPGWARPARLS